MVSEKVPWKIGTGCWDKKWVVYPDGRVCYRVYGIESEWDPSSEVLREIILKVAGYVHKHYGSIQVVDEPPQDVPLLHRYKIELPCGIVIPVEVRSYIYTRMHAPLEPFQSLSKQVRAGRVNLYDQLEGMSLISEQD